MSAEIRFIVPHVTSIVKDFFIFFLTFLLFGKNVRMGMRRGRVRGQIAEYALPDSGGTFILHAFCQKIAFLLKTCYNQTENRRFRARNRL